MQTKHARTTRMRRLMQAGILLCLMMMAGCASEEIVQKSSYLKQPVLSEKSLAQLKGRDESKVSEAQQWFNNRFPQTRAGNSEWQLMWNYAFTDSLVNSKTVEIPIAFIQQKNWVLPECMKRYEQTKDERYLQNIVRYIVEKNNTTGKMRSYFMIIMPSAKYLEKKNFVLNENSYGQMDKEFDGYVMYSNNNGYFNNGWIYEDGKVTAKLEYPESQPLTRSAQEICMYETEITYTDWYVNGNYDHTTINEVAVTIIDCWVKRDPERANRGGGGGGSNNDGNSSGYDETATPGVQYGKHGKIGPCTDCYEEEEIPEDKIIEDPSFVGTKADCVYDKLNNLSGGFKAAIQKFDGEFPVSHLKFTASSSLGSDINAATIPPVNYVTEIQINSNNLNRPNLSIARTIIHETIHAEMFRKLLSAAQKGNLQFKDWKQEEVVKFITNLHNNYPGIYDFYYKNYKKEWSHEQMAGYYRNYIIKLLKEYDSSQSDELYQSLAWEGLMDTYTWEKLSSSEKNKIKNLINNYDKQGGEECK